MAPKNLKRVRQGAEEDATEASVPEQSLVERFNDLSCPKSWEAQKLLFYPL
jgi:hypothetical protein